MGCQLPVHHSDLCTPTEGQTASCSCTLAYGHNSCDTRLCVCKVALFPHTITRSVFVAVQQQNATLRSFKQLQEITRQERWGVSLEERLISALKNHDSPLVSNLFILAPASFFCAWTWADLNQCCHKNETGNWNVERPKVSGLQTHNADVHSGVWLVVLSRTVLLWLPAAASWSSAALSLSEGDKLMML